MPCILRVFTGPVFLDNLAESPARAAGPHFVRGRSGGHASRPGEGGTSAGLGPIPAGRAARFAVHGDSGHSRYQTPAPGRRNRIATIDATEPPFDPAAGDAGGAAACRDRTRRPPDQAGAQPGAGAGAKTDRPFPRSAGECRFALPGRRRTDGQRTAPAVLITRATMKNAQKTCDPARPMGRHAYMSTRRHVIRNCVDRALRGAFHFILESTNRTSRIVPPPPFALPRPGVPVPPSSCFRV